MNIKIHIILVIFFTASLHGFCLTCVGGQNDAGLSVLLGKWVGTVRGPYGEADSTRIYDYDTDKCYIRYSDRLQVSKTGSADTAMSRNIRGRFITENDELYMTEAAGEGYEINYSVVVLDGEQTLLTALHNRKSAASGPEIRRTIRVKYSYQLEETVSFRWSGGEWIQYEKGVYRKVLDNGKTLPDL